MWFGSLVELFSASRAPRSPRIVRDKAARLRAARRLLFEPLDARRVLAFNLFSDSTSTVPSGRIDVSGDFTGDGLADLVVSNGSSPIQLYVATGGGNFAAPVDPGVPGTSVATGDVNADGKLDLVTNQAIALGNGNGTFQTPTPFSLPPMIPWGYDSLVEQSPGSVAVGDVNGDGKLDLAVTGRSSVSVYIGWGYYGPYYNHYSSGHVNVLLGNGDGTVQPATVSDFPQQMGSWAESAALAQLNDDDGDGDADGDDNLDLVVKARDTWSTGGYSLLGQGNGQFSPATYRPSFDSDRPVLGDFDEDGFLDQVSYTSATLWISRGLPSGGSGPLTEVSLGGPPSIPRSVAVGDLNADGHLDISVTAQRLYIPGYGYYDNPYPYYGWGSGTVHDSVKVLLGTGAGTFEAPITSALGVHEGYSGIGAHSSVLADVNGDGRLDLALADRYQNRLTVALNDGVWVPPAALSIDDVEIIEGDTGQKLAVFTVTAVGDHAGITADFRTESYTATAGLDYAHTEGTITFAPGETSQTFSVPILGDKFGEPSETFQVVLFGVSGAIVVDGRAVGTITDNEPTVSINHVYGIDPLTVVEGDTGTTAAVFTVTLSAPYSEEVTVDYFTSTGHTSDIVSASGTLRFLPGDTSETITVQVVGDLIDEQLEAFNVYLTNSPTANIVSGAGYCYIEDNDPSPSVTISDVSKKEGNKTTTRFDFTVRLSAAASEGVWVSYSTASGTATEGQDYLAEWGTIFFAPGQTTATISIDVKGDKTKESSETFFVNLTSDSLVTIADGQAMGTILDDDNTNPGKGHGKPHGSPSESSAQGTSESDNDAALAAWLASTFTTPRKRT